MTTLEYMENVLGLDLLDYQKTILRELEKLPRDQKLTITYPPHNGRTDFRLLYEATRIFFFWKRYTPRTKRKL